MRRKCYLCLVVSSKLFVLLNFVIGSIETPTWKQGLPIIYRSEDKLSKEEGRDCKDLRHLNSSSQRDELTLRNHSAAAFVNETSSSFNSIVSFFKEAILLNGSISNTNGSLMRRSLSKRWQLLVVGISPREISLGQFSIFNCLSAASLAISSARGRDVMFGQAKTLNVSRGIGFELLQKFKVVHPILHIVQFFSLEGKEGNSFTFGQLYSSSLIKQGNKHPSSAATPASNQSSNASNPLIYNSSSNGKARVVFPIPPWPTIDRREMFLYKSVPRCSFDGFLNHCTTDSLSSPRPMRSFLGKDPVSRVL
ncbi:hypothetical protein IEQ34_008189 [Dendrobium chrysotoxum]|uniref:Uncharacterized protein n=1 Tax=Dendrobium chrysotoxum TaxID=161865 RepID=A0AAV7H6S5_DENCH|nr:hypothetical protein IEQ34_008189 [Dendrobium chrysotoxum]